jgi:hypothetical protein
MKKKSDKVEKEVAADEEEDEEEAEGGADSDDDEGEEEAEERPAVSARAVADERRARRVAAAAKAPKKSAAHDGHGHDDEDEESADGEDPSWWLPHAVMSVLVLIGVLGFFGTFNKLLAPLAAHPAGQGDATTTKEETKAVEPTKAATPTPPMPQAPQAPREMFAAKHLLVMYKGGRRAPEGITRTKDEAKARATEAQKKAKDGKIKFEDLVKEYSDEPRAGERGGDLGTFPKGSMVPEFQAALDKMKIGEISDVVETPFGFHVILRTAPAAPAMPPGH